MRCCVSAYHYALLRQRIPLCAAASAPEQPPPSRARASPSSPVLVDRRDRERGHRFGEELEESVEAEGAAPDVD